MTPAAAGDGRSTLGLEGTRIVCPQLGRREQPNMDVDHLSSVPLVRDQQPTRLGCDPERMERVYDERR